MNEYQKKCICTNTIYDELGILFNHEDLTLVNKESSGDSLFALHDEDVTILCLVTYDGLPQIKTIYWNKNK